MDRVSQDVITPTEQRQFLAEAWREYTDEMMTWAQWRRLRALILGIPIPTAEEGHHA